MHFTTLSAILRGGWLIDRSFVQAHLPVIAGVLKSQGTGAELFTGNAAFEQPFIVKDGKRVPAYVWEFERDQGYVQVFNEKNFPANATAVIPIIGPVMKYQGDCGEPGMIKRSAWTMDLAGSNKIGKLCFYEDTPGGQADGTPQFSDLILNISKPTLAYVSGGAYSAGAWIASACDEIVLADKFAGIGSIGVYQTYMDFSKYLKKMGVEMKDIYAEQSTEKNLAWRKADEGDFSLIKEGVTDLAGHFIEQFSTNRAGKLKNDSWNTGATFNGQAAIDLGLADRMASFDDAIAIKKKVMVTVTTPKSHNSNSSNMKFPKVFSLAGKETVAQDELDQANAELGEAGITGHVLVPEALVTDAATATATAERLTNELSTVQNSLTAANGQVTSLTAERDTLKAKVAKGPAPVAPAVAETDPIVEDDAEAEGRAKIAALPHNQALANNPMFNFPKK